MHPKETRYRAVVHYNHFLRSLRRVAAHYGVSKSSLQRWVRATGREVRARRSKKALRDSVRRCVEDAITENPFTTARELASVLRTACGLRMSRSTANRLTRAAGFTYKKAVSRPLSKIRESTVHVSFYCSADCRELLRSVPRDDNEIVVACVYTSRHPRDARTLRRPRA